MLSTTPLTLDTATDDAVAGGDRVITPSAEMKQAASEIARQCLRLWDGFLGIPAGSDSAGAKAGVWRGKFDGVRCAVLLLAFRKLNKSLQMHSDAPSRFGMLNRILSESYTMLFCQMASRMQACVVCHHMHHDIAQALLVMTYV